MVGGWPSNVRRMALTSRAAGLARGRPGTAAGWRLRSPPQRDFFMPIAALGGSRRVDWISITSIELLKAKLQAHKRRQQVQGRW